MLRTVETGRIGISQSAARLNGDLRGAALGPRGEEPEDIEWEERLLRVGLGAPDVRAAVAALRERGLVFVDRDPIQPSDKGALTQIYLGGVTFELVVSHLESDATAKVRAVP